MALAPLTATLTDWVGPVEAASLFRLALAATLGAAVGWERERHGRAAGLHTHMLLCLGCALIVVIPLHLPTLFTGSAGRRCWTIRSTSTRGWPSAS